MRLVLTIEGPPVPKARARYSPRNRRWYTPEPTRRYESHVRGLFELALVSERLWSKWPRLREYDVTADVYFPDRRKRDGDNVLKSILDAGNRVLWNDDSQVRRHEVETHVDRERPRVELLVEVRG